MQKTEMRQPVTAKDIGRRLGLSQPTVSRILSGAPGCRVSAETRRRVLEAAAEMGYRPNAIARSLRRRRTNIIGLYCGYGYLDARNAFQAAVIGGLQRAADEHHLDLLLHGVFRGTSTEDIYGELIDGRVDGLFLNTHPDDPLAEKFRASALPVVALADALPDLPSVVCDDAEGIRLLLAYLWEKGHRRIGFLCPEQVYASVAVRRDAFISVMADRGARAEEAPLLTIDGEAGESALALLPTLPVRPTAVVCWNDLTALRLMKGCREQGVRMPDDLAVVGFDGLLDFGLMARQLVTVGTDWNAAMAEAMRLLTTRIKDGPNAAIPPLTKMPVRLIPGDTA
jgi:DNA-binding LacI/PurR family transcriptional regulator